MKFDFVVAGAGVAGMTAAVILAKAGYAVALVEKAPHLGPLLRGFQRQGIYFDTGFHYTGALGDGEALDLFFRYLGIADKVEKIPFSRDGFDVVCHGGSRPAFAFPWGYERIQESLQKAFPSENEAILRYLRLVRETCDQLPYLNLDAPLTGHSVFSASRGASLKEVLDGLTHHADLKRLLCTHVFLYGVDPAQAPFSLHAAIVGPYYQSVHGIRGGGLSLVQAFEKRLAQLGVSCFMGNGVAGLEINNQRTLERILLSDGRKIDCRGCVYTGHPKLLLNIVPSSVFRPAYRRRLTELKESPSAAILYARCDDPVVRLKGCNLYDGFWGYEERHLTEGSLEERPLYITRAPAIDSADAKSGIIAICAFRYSETQQWEDSFHGNRPPAYRLKKQNIAAILQKRVVKALPEVQGKLHPVEVATPLTMRDYTHSPYGSLYGIQHCLGQINPFPVTRVSGLFLAGQSVVAPGVMGAMLSSFLTCGSIIGHSQLRKDLRACR
jgi:all-trans-retinol 13,14-reductase